MVVYMIIVNNMGSHYCKKGVDIMTIKTIRKRNGESVPYDRNRIRQAMAGANHSVGSPLLDMQIDLFLSEVEGRIYDGIGVEEIQNIVESVLSDLNQDVFIAYHDYRREHALARRLRANATDEVILGLVGINKKGTITEDVKLVMEENSNKQSSLASTQRDKIAGEVSKDLSLRVLLPKDVVEAHLSGAIHFHDIDYFLQPIFNCCLVDIGNMLDYGFAINGKMIESPKSFQVACTVMTQAIANIASCQYGGQSLDIRHLSKYLRVSEEKYRRKFLTDGISGEMLERLVAHFLHDELAAGLQTIQYQINTLMTTNGQSPFVTLFMYVDPEHDPYVKYTVMIIEELLKQRIQGIKNEKGVHITPAFPKLIYVLDECNCLKGGEYDWLTELAVRCTAKRMYPDYISAKMMRENYEGNVFSPMGCRSFLSPWKDENGNYKFEGRFNQGVVSINLPQIAILANGDMDKFWQILNERLCLCRKALMSRHEALLGTASDISPLHFQYGAIARLKKGEVIDPLLKGGYSTLSLGYIGVYETTKLMTGESHTGSIGQAFAVKLMKRLRNATDTWKEETGLGFGLYGTPAESLCYRFARIDKERFGDIPDITDKGYYTNSYHVDVREKIDAFSKFQFESQFQKISSGGAISYVEIPNMKNNLEALAAVVQFIYDNILYAEFNTKSDYCQVCGWNGEILINEDNEWECPQCHNKDHSKMNVARRTCGYLGENFWNVGKTKEIKARVLHL